MTQNQHPVFKAIDEYAPLHIYRRNLPHWRQKEATYFITFRLGDSIPRSVIRGWQYEDAAWMKAHGINGPLSAPKWRETYEKVPENERLAYERRIAHRLHVELDQCHGTCIFREDAPREQLVSALQYFHGERWWVGDFVVMPNHVHGLFQPIGEYRLECSLQSVKGYVSTCLCKAGVKTGRLWQQESYDRLIRNRQELAVWRRYIHDNPAKAGLRNDDYTYYRCTWLDVK